VSEATGDLNRGRAPRAEHREVLRRRAVALARKPRAPIEGDFMTALLFEYGDARYAVDAAAVLQVTPLRDLTPLPGAALPLLGVTYWRGQVLTVFDLRGPLGVRVRGLTDMGKLIVLDGPHHDFGILADRVPDMRLVDVGALRPAEARAGRDGALLRGMTDDAVLVIDAATLLRTFGAAHSGPTMGRGG
jgi:purine-binding chemotaxis protein CheW